MTIFTQKSFAQLSTDELFNIYEARVAVFVVEQECYYQEVDEDDRRAQHVFALNEEGKLMAYARMIPEEDHHVRIGRVLVAQPYRQSGLGRELVSDLLAKLKATYPETVVVDAQAQAYLQRFYESFGFQAQSDVYLETGIPHLDMSLTLA